MRTAPTRVPLMVGVTGHRDLVEEQVPRLEQVVEAFFGELRRHFPELPLLVTTPLAEGSDRLVARVAHRLDIPLNILLPMPLALYEQDFDGSAAETFADMLELGDVIELPLLTGPSRDLLPGGATRDAQYEYLGIYLAAHSHILLALWDGKPSPAPGGTAQVLRFHQQNEVQSIPGVEARSAIDFSEDESDLAYHIACSRAGNGPPVAGLVPGEHAWLTRDDLEPRTRELPERYQAVFRQQEQLNRDLAASADTPPSGSSALPSSSADKAAGEIGALLTAVDALAIRYQRLGLRALRGIYLLAALTGASFIAYADFPDQEGMIWAYLAFLGLGFLVYLLERRGAWYRRYVDYRGLAEGLRVQAHWAMAGVRMENPTEFCHDLFMRSEELSLGWIRNVMRYAGRHSDAIAATSPTSALKAVEDHWIRSQHDYYRRRLRERLRKSWMTSRLSMLGFGLGLCAAIVLALFQERLADMTVSALIATMVGLPYLAAVRSSYAERICERELIAQYAHMDRIYANAHRLLQTTQDPVAKRGILRALGEEALQEVGQWILRQRERPVSGDQLFRTG